MGLAALAPALPKDLVQSIQPLVAGTPHLARQPAGAGLALALLEHLKGFARLELRLGSLGPRYGLLGPGQLSALRLGDPLLHRLAQRVQLGP